MSLMKRRENDLGDWHCLEKFVLEAVDIQLNRRVAFFYGSKGMPGLVRGTRLLCYGTESVE